MDSIFITSVTTLATATVTGFLTFLATRKSNSANAKKTDTEADVLKTDSYLSLVKVNQEAHTVIETNYRNVVQSMAAEIDRLRVNEKRNEERIHQLEKALQDEREDCDLKIAAVEKKWSEIREQDRHWFMEEISKKAKS